MKTFYKIVLCALSLCTLLCGCNKKDNSFDVSGDCKIEKMVLDNQFTAVVDHAARTAVVPVPEVHNDQLMTITELTLSPGAKANMKQGDKGISVLLTKYSIRSPFRCLSVRISKHWCRR